MLGYPLATLPKELINEIVGWVEVLGTKDDIWSLLGCDRSFGDHCRAILFKTLVLNIADPNNLALCHRIFMETPAIASYVRELQLQGEGGAHPLHVWSDTQPECGHILQALAATQRPPASLKLGIFYISNPTSFTHWLTTSFLSTSIVRLHLEQVHFPLGALGALRNLKSLRFDYCLFKKKDITRAGAEERWSVDMPELEELEWRGSYEVLREIFRDDQSTSQTLYVSLKNLRVMRGHAEDHRGVGLVQGLISHTCSTLEELEVANKYPRYRYTYVPLSGTLRLEKLHHLQRLRFSIMCGKILASNEEGLATSDIAGVLSTIPVPNHTLEMVSICIKSAAPSWWPSILLQDWLVVFDQIKRISGDRGMMLEVEIWAQERFATPAPHRNWYSDLDASFSRELGDGHVRYRLIHHDNGN
ncbi:hypothetical protein BKA70DRAFT_1361742 [Coprinopsis sp. MPI-PUGE-AT-0042]|nr:hypothetical protein BKA70DRAFT_1361742 [Coprinopsis sp. MPI-PUGE-AT-0042]